MSQLQPDPIEICAYARPWNTHPCTNPADVWFHDGERIVPICAECANRSGVMFDARPDPH